MLNELLTTPRLRLEPLAPEHADEIAVAYLDERLWTYFPALRPADADALQVRFARWSAGPSDAAANERWGNWVAFLGETRTPVGVFQATLVGEEPAALAYAVFIGFQRRGYALEAVRAIVDHLRDHEAVRRIAAEMDARNAPSIAIARRLGMREVGRAEVDDERTGARGTELRYEGEAETGSPMTSEETLAAIRRLVGRDPAFAARLRAIPKDAFLGELAAIADSAGLALDEAAIRSAVGAAEHSWRMRWLG